MENKSELKIKSAIKVREDNFHEVMRLPCVRSAKKYKRGEWRFQIFDDVMEYSPMIRVGEWICEDEKGRFFWMLNQDFLKTLDPETNIQDWLRCSVTADSIAEKVNVLKEVTGAYENILAKLRKEMKDLNKAFAQ